MTEIVLSQMQEFETPEEALAHYGVKGMRWGVTKKDGGSVPKRKVTSTEVKNARAKVASKQRAINAQIDKTNLASGKRQEAEAKKLADMSVDFLKDPNRATALRLTKGEKVALTVLAVGFPGFGTAAAAASAGGMRVSRANVQRNQRKMSDS